MMWWCFFRISSFGHTSQIKEECRSFCSKIRKIFSAGYPFSFCYICSTMAVCKEGSIFFTNSGVIISYQCFVINYYFCLGADASAIFVTVCLNFSCTSFCIALSSVRIVPCIIQFFRNNIISYTTLNFSNSNYYRCFCQFRLPAYNGLQSLMICAETQ